MKERRSLSALRAVWAVGWAFGANAAAELYWILKWDRHFGGGQRFISKTIEWQISISIINFYTGKIADNITYEARAAMIGSFILTCSRNGIVLSE